MFREHDTALRQTMMFVDLTVIIAAFSFSYLIRNSYYEFFGLHIVTVYKTYPFESYIGLVPLIVIPWAGALHFAGSYQQIRGKKLGKLLHEIFLAGILAWLIFGSMAFIFKLHFVSRSLIVLSFMVTWAALALDRLTLLKTLQIIRKRGFNTRYMLVVGTGKRAQTFIQRIEKHSEWGFQIKGLIDNDPDLVGATIAGYPVLGVLSDLPELLEKVI
ncbi:MAG: hypothetical protein H6757_05870, partial [Candidatus Omnitrophica bacterium]|nr:hypothetical protein [Candidatus Omnitrophota bacterium]